MNFYSSFSGGGGGHGGGFGGGGHHGGGFGGGGRHGGGLFHAPAPSFHAVHHTPPAFVSVSKQSFRFSNSFKCEKIGCKRNQMFVFFSNCILNPKINRELTW